MLTKLRIQMEPEEGKRITRQMSSVMQGILMQLVDSEYAETLHQEGWNPYSQYLSFEKEEVYWNIHTMTDEAYEQIIVRLLSPEIQEIKIEKHDILIYLKEKVVSQISKKALAQDFYSTDSDRYFHLRFLTPTAFKQSGRYTFYPDIRCMYQSLMNKYDAVSTAEQFSDEEVLEQLTKDTVITRYNLRSTTFSLEGVRIPSFVGELTLKVNGTQTMANLVNLLFRFGEYSGIGIKTGIGMGAVCLVERRNDK